MKDLLRWRGGSFVAGQTRRVLQAASHGTRPPGKPMRVWIAFTGDQHYALRLIRFRGNIPLSKTVYLLQGLEVASSAQSTCA